jgi:hypothetical protein
MIYDRAPTVFNELKSYRGTFSRAINPSWHENQSASKVAVEFPNRKLRIECKFQRKPESSRATTPQSYQTSRSAELWTPKPWNSTTRSNSQKRKSKFDFDWVSISLPHEISFFEHETRSISSITSRFHVQLITLLVQKLQNTPKVNGTKMTRQWFIGVNWVVNTNCATHQISHIFSSISKWSEQSERSKKFENPKASMGEVVQGWEKCRKAEEKEEWKCAEMSN